MVYVHFCYIRAPNQGSLSLPCEIMHRYSSFSLVVLIGVIVLTSSACTFRMREASDEEQAQVVAEIMALTQQVQAAAERTDVLGLFRYHSDPGTFEHIHNGVRFTRDELIADYREIYADVESQEIDIGDPLISILSRNVVLVASQGTFKTTMKSGSTLSGDIAWTYVWQREGESWTLLHAHQSFPGPIGRAE